MIEIFPDISPEVRDVADTAWKLALSQKDPMDAANFLNLVTSYYDKQFSEEEVEFLRFYFQMKMEMIKE